MLDDGVFGALHRRIIFVAVDFIGEDGNIAMGYLLSFLGFFATQQYDTFLNLVEQWPLRLACVGGFALRILIRHVATIFVEAFRCFDTLGAVLLMVGTVKHFIADICSF